MADMSRHNGGQPYNFCQAVDVDASSHVCPKVDNNNNILRVLDLRQRDSFASAHISGSLNVSLPSCFSETPSPFDDVAILKSQYRDLEDLAAHLCTTKGEVEGEGDFNVAGPFLIVCYTGETARLACSIFRRRNIEAYSLLGGSRAITGHSCELQGIKVLCKE